MASEAVPHQSRYVAVIADRNGETLQMQRLSVLFKRRSLERPRYKLLHLPSPRAGRRNGLTLDAITRPGSRFPSSALKRSSSP